MKKVEYNNLKVIAILLVLLSHSTYYTIMTNFGGINYEQWLLNDNSIFLYKAIDKFREVIYYFHMPLFMAISGAFFQMQVKKNKWVNLSPLVLAKSKRLMIPFIIFTLLYTIPVKYISNYFLHTDMTRAVVGQLFLLGNSHLWYLYALFIIFIIAYFVLRKNSGIWVLLFVGLLHVISYKIEITLIKAPIQFLFYFALGFKFEQNREAYNKFLDNKKGLLGSPFLLLFNSYISINNCLLYRIFVRFIMFLR